MTRPKIYLSMVLWACFWNASLPPEVAARERSDLTADEQVAIASRIAAAMDGAQRFPEAYDLDVWMLAARTRLARWLPNGEDQLLLLETVLQESARHQLDPDLILAVIEVESHFNRFAVSRAGALGIMQIMPFWKDEIGRPDDNLIDLDTNVRYGAAILAHYMDASEADLVKALSRYNGTTRLRYANKVVRALRANWRSGDQPQLDAACAQYALPAC